MGTQEPTTWSLQQYIVVCLVILAVQSQGNLVDANIWSLPPHSGVPQNVAREVGCCNHTIACGKERSIGPMLGSWKSGQVEFGVVIVVDVKDTVNSQNPQVSQ